MHPTGWLESPLLPMRIKAHPTSPEHKAGGGVRKGEEHLQADYMLIRDISKNHATGELEGKGNTFPQSVRGGCAGVH